MALETFVPVVNDLMLLNEVIVKRRVCQCVWETMAKFEQKKHKQGKKLKKRERERERVKCYTGGKKGGGGIGDASLR